MGEGFELGYPVGVDRPVGLEVSPHPGEHALSTGANRDFDSVVEAGDSCSRAHDLVELGNMAVYKVVASAAAEKDHGIRVFEKGVRIFGPVDGIAILDSFVRVGFFQPLSNQSAARGVFVFSKAMGSLVGYETEDGFVLAPGRKKKTESQDGQENESSEVFCHGGNFVMPQLEGQGREGS